MAQNSIDVNSAVSTIEGDAAKWLASQALSKLVIAYPALAGWVSGPIGWLLTIAAAIFIHYGDLLAYLFIDQWETSHEATNYENAAAAARTNPNPQTLADQEAAFRNLFG